MKRQTARGEEGATERDTNALLGEIFDTSRGFSARRAASFPRWILLLKFRAAAADVDGLFLPRFFFGVGYCINTARARGNFTREFLMSRRDEYSYAACDCSDVLIFFPRARKNVGYSLCIKGALICRSLNIERLYKEDLSNSVKKRRG